MNQRIFLLLIILLSLFVAVISLGGIFIPATYLHETADWRAQGIAQDIFDLCFAVPALLIATWFYLRGSRIAFFTLVGQLIFLIYTLIIYAFSLHFNAFFLLYCFTLGLASYLLIYLLWQTGSLNVKGWFAIERSVTLPMIYLLSFAALFYMLWLNEIIPALISSSTPAALAESGLPTNPVYVLDLSILLPGFVITALLLKRRHALGYLFTPAIMTFCATMTFSIATLVVYEYTNGLATSFAVALIMIALAIVSIVVFLRTIQGVRSGSLFGELRT
jgi:hypothetical protein